MSSTIVSHLQTDIGRRREQNEDNFVWLRHLWGKPSTLLIGVIDGVGGYEGGEVAADIAKNTIESYLQQLSFGAPLQLLKEAVINANNNIYQKRQSGELPRMSCVLTVAILDAEKEMMYVAHVGDTRGYIFRKGELIKFTKDHSIVGFKEDNGYITEEEAMQHPQRNEISKMLGEQLLDANDSEGYLDVFEHSFFPNDIVLLCSDGLTDLVTRKGISDILSANAADLVHCAQLLIDKANELGGKDNITVGLATYEVKATGKKKTYKRTIEVPISTEDIEPTVTNVQPKRKKKEWWWLLPVVFLVGFLANWTGTRNLLFPGANVKHDTIYVKDTLSTADSLLFNDTLIQATDTIFRERSSQNLLDN